MCLFKIEPSCDRLDGVAARKPKTGSAFKVRKGVERNAPEPVINKETPPGESGLWGRRVPFHGLTQLFPLNFDGKTYSDRPEIKEERVISCRRLLLNSAVRS